MMSLNDSGDDWDQCCNKASKIFNTRLTKDKSKMIQAEGSATNEDQFRGVDDLKEVTRAAQEEYNRRNATRNPAFANLGKWAEVLDKNAPVIDVMMQQPFFVNLVWGSARFIIQAAARASKAGPEIAAGLRTTLELIPNLLRVFQTHSGVARVSERVSLVLAHIICYLVNTKHLLRKSGLKRLARLAFSPKLRQILADIDQANTALAREIDLLRGEALKSIAQNQYNSSAKAEVEFELQDAHRQDLNKFKYRTDKNFELLGKAVNISRNTGDYQHISMWLKKGLPSSTISASAEAGTCQWIWSNSEYQRWIESNCKGCFCIEGIGGCGKTTLAKFLADQTPENSLVARVSFRSSSRREYLAATAEFSAKLLKDLFRYIDPENGSSYQEVFEYLRKLSQQDDSAIESSVPRLLGALDKLVSVVSNLVLIVDALEECIEFPAFDTADYRRLITYLQKLGRLPNVRVLLFSRLGVFIDPIFAGSPLIRMSKEVVTPDIKLFVSGEIARSQKLNPDLWEMRSKIVGKVSKRAQGVFLWARRAMDDLRNTSKANDIEKRLEAFPTKLADFYFAELQEVHSNLSEEDKSTRNEIFLLILGAFDLLTAHEVSLFLALDTKTNCVEKGDCLSNPLAAILRNCRPVVEVVGDEQVQFVHTSAKAAACQIAGSTPENADELLALKCLSKLSQSEYRDWKIAAKLLRHNLLPGDVIDKICPEESSFNFSNFLKSSIPYEFAVLNWYKYVTRLPEPSEDIIDKLAQFLWGNEFVTWSESLFTLKPKKAIGAHIQVRAVLLEWHRSLPEAIKTRIPISGFFVQSHEALSIEFKMKGEDKILPYLPLQRLGQYFNVGGRTPEDFQKAYHFKMKVAAGFEEALGIRNPLTLRAKTEVFKEFFYQKRFDEAARGLHDVARIQREVISEQSIDYCFTLQLLGLAELCITKFESAVSTYIKAADGFRYLQGDDAFLTLQTEMGIGQALEHTPRLEEAYELYQKLLRLWIPIGRPKHPFSLMLKTSLGSVCRKTGRFTEANEVLLEALVERQHLSTTKAPESPATIDSVLQVAALYYDCGRGKCGIEYLDLLNDSKNTKNDFERHCQEVHIRALINLSRDFYTKAKIALQRILFQGSGEDRDKNNRELLWVRITLADMLRQREEYAEALMLFMDLTWPRLLQVVPPTGTQAAPGHEFPSSLVDEPQTPAQLEITEKALRLVKDAKQDEAAALLAANDLRWRRKKDFWVIQGGPFTDTASICGVRQEGFQIIGLPASPSVDGEPVMAGETDSITSPSASTPRVATPDSSASPSPEAVLVSCSTQQEWIRGCEIGQGRDISLRFGRDVVMTEDGNGKGRFGKIACDGTAGAESRQF